MAVFAAEQFVMPKPKLVSVPYDAKSVLDGLKTKHLQWVCQRCMRSVQLEVIGDVGDYLVAYVQKTSSDNSQRFAAVLAACTGALALKLDYCRLSKAVVEAILRRSSLRDFHVREAHFVEHEQFNANDLPSCDTPAFADTESL